MPGIIAHGLTANHALVVPKVVWYSFVYSSGWAQFRWGDWWYLPFWLLLLHRHGAPQLLESIAPNPMVTLNRAVALAMVRGPDAGLRLLESLDDDERLARHHRLPAVRAHLLEMAGQAGPARAAYLAAARRTTSAPEKRYLETRAARLAAADGPGRRAARPVSCH